MKVTKELIESIIKDTQFTRINQTMTHCQIVTHCGFAFSGESACIDPASFNEETGKKISYDNAYEKIWSHLGFYLMQSAYQADHDKTVEVREVWEKLYKYVPYNSEELIEPSKNKAPVLFVVNNKVYEGYLMGQIPGEEYEGCELYHRGSSPLSSIGAALIGTPWCFKSDLEPKGDETTKEPEQAVPELDADAIPEFIKETHESKYKHIKKDHPLLIEAQKAGTAIVFVYNKDKLNKSFHGDRVFCDKGVYEGLAEAVGSFSEYGNNVIFKSKSGSIAVVSEVFWCLKSDLPGHAIKPETDTVDITIKWSEPRKAKEGVSCYDHVEWNGYLIEWKSWKQHDTYDCVIYVEGSESIYIGENTLEEAKAAFKKAYLLMIQGKEVKNETI